MKIIKIGIFMVCLLVIGYFTKVHDYVNLALPISDFSNWDQISTHITKDDLTPLNTEKISPKATSSVSQPNPSICSVNSSNNGPNNYQIAHYTQQIAQLNSNKSKLEERIKELEDREINDYRDYQITSLIDKNTFLYHLLQQQQEELNLLNAQIIKQTINAYHNQSSLTLQTAFHEAGHALIALYYPDVFTFIYCNIRASKGLAGNTYTLVSLDKPLLLDDYKAHIYKKLGGTAAEKYAAYDLYKISKGLIGAGSTSDHKEAMSFIKQLHPNLTDPPYQILLSFYIDQAYCIIKTNADILDIIVRELLIHKTVTNQHLKDLQAKHQWQIQHI